MFDFPVDHTEMLESFLTWGQKARACPQPVASPPSSGQVNHGRSNSYLWSIPCASFSRAFTEPLFAWHQHVKPKLLPGWSGLCYLTSKNALAFAVSPSSISLWIPAHIYKDPLQNHRSRKEGWYYLQAVKGQPIALFWVEIGLKWCFDFPWI